jgi:arylsulfatase A
MRIVLFVCLFCIYGFKSKSQTKPNIVFIMCDDLGIKDLPSYGNLFNETPFLDKLAKAGIVCQNAYASSTVCSPSRSAIMTGKHPARTKITNYLGGENKPDDSQFLPANWQRGLKGTEITLAEKLKSVGYSTAMIGKWHLGGNEGESPWEQGFDYTRMIGKNGLHYYNNSIFEDSFKNEKIIDSTQYLTDVLGSYAVDFIAKQQTAKPFFLYLNFSAPHVFLEAKQEKLQKYKQKLAKVGGEHNPTYAAMIESVDEGVKRIVQELTNKNLMANTLIIFTSDNGGVGLPELGPTPTSNAPYKKWKGHCYEGGIKIPAIFYWEDNLKPNIEDVNQFVHTDYFATFAKLSGYEMDEMPDSKVIKSLIRSIEFNKVERPLYWHYPHFSNQEGRPAGAMREGRWKIIRSYETNVTELYDLQTDIAEANNLAMKYPEILRSLNKKFDDWLKSVDANMPIRK